MTICDDCGHEYEWADMHYYWNKTGRHCRGRGK